ncbi:extracellular solute-binding protein [Effusibacillus pohliae]|uniref:extracellular solute-binding protein n=1 Tax=Effusibacillus pohliae TaxID=232270 RepID=UPI000381BBF6|nr:extracellular solute-binding protein [Effusibacillus pohliae]
MEKKWTKKLLIPSLVSIMALVSACGGGGGTANSGTPAAGTGSGQAADYDKLTSEQLAEKIKSEGSIVSYGMPDTWANLGEIWKGFTTKYGISHTDTDMSSAEELAKFEAEKDKPVADVGDVGITFGPQGKERGVLMAHKNKYWNEIPDWAKDPDGYWAAEYTGTIAFLVNTKKVKNVPKTFDDLLKPEYKGMVSIDDPTRSAQAKAGVLAAAFAHGGNESNIQPGIDFFKKLFKAGNYKPLEVNIANIQKGEIGIGIVWDFNALNWKDQLKMDEITVVIPSDGTVSIPYVAVINKYAPHPYTAKAFNDYLFSDEAQIAYAKGFARPIRNVRLPDDVAKKLLPAEAYASAKNLKDFKKWDETASKTLPSLWEEQVLPEQK